MRPREVIEALPFGQLGPQIDVIGVGEQLIELLFIGTMRTLDFAIEIASAPGEPGGRAQAVFQHCFENGVLVRASGENIVLSPPLIITANEIAILFGAIATAIKSLP